MSLQGLIQRADFGETSAGHSLPDHKPIEQTIECLPWGVRRLAAQLHTQLSKRELWLVLTDYEHLSNFIPNLASSQILNRSGNRIHLHQIGSQQLLGLRFSATVELELVEHYPEGLIVFHMLRGDFRRFEGAWRIRSLPKSDATLLLYELTVQACTGMPIRIIEQRLREDLTANLMAVHKEAQQRAAVG